MAEKPRKYELHQCPTSTGHMQAHLDLVCCDEDGIKDIFISTQHTISLKSRSARALAKRLIAMANWMGSVNP